MLISFASNMTTSLQSGVSTRVLTRVILGGYLGGCLMCYLVWHLVTIDQLIFAACRGGWPSSCKKRKHFTFEHNRGIIIASEKCKLMLPDNAQHGTSGN